MMDLIRSLTRVWIQFREFERTRRELTALSDRQLADIGIAREDIARMAFEHAEAHAARAVPEAESGRSFGTGGAGLRFSNVGHAR